MHASNSLLRVVPFALLLCFAAAAQAQRITLEPLKRGGYGEVELKRPRPNVLTATAEIDGRKVSLLVDTGWSGEGIGLFDTPAVPTAERVTLGNVQLAKVPLAAITPEP